MKILLVIHDYWPNYNAGTENHTHYLAQALSKNNEVFIFTTEPNSDNEDRKVYWEDKVKVIKIHTQYGKHGITRGSYLNDNLDQIFRDWINDIQPDIVHIQHLIGLSLSFIDIVKEKKIPLVYTLHDFWYECPFIRRYKNEKNCIITKSNLGDCNACMQLVEPFNESTLKGPRPVGFLRNVKHNTAVFSVLKLLRNAPVIDGLFTFLLGKIRKKKAPVTASKKVVTPIEERWNAFKEYYEKVDLFITPSSFLTNDAVKFGINKNKILKIRHGIPSLSKKEKSSKVYTKDSRVNFGFASHIAEEKGFYALLDAFKKLSSEQMNTKLLIYGYYHQDDKKIKSTVNNLSGNIVYKGVYDSKDTVKVLEEMDVLVVPSLWNEIFGLVIDEAYLCNKPVVVSNRGAMPERVKDGKGGFVFDPDKEDDLYNKLAKIAKNPQILNDVQKNLPEVKSMEDYATEVEEIYKKLLVKV